MEERQALPRSPGRAFGLAMGYSSRPYEDYVPSRHENVNAVAATTPASADDASTALVIWSLLGSFGR